jgi:hypothetical protein
MHGPERAERGVRLRRKRSGERKRVNVGEWKVTEHQPDLTARMIETLPHLASGENNTFWVIPGELTQAIRAITEAFGDYSRMGAPSTDKGKADSPPLETDDVEDSRELTSGGPPRLDEVAAADRVAELADAAVNDAKAQAAAARGHEA